MRTSKDEIDEQGYIKEGFDYTLQVWVQDYIIQNCGHSPERKDCCNARALHGRNIKNWQGEELIR